MITKKSISEHVEYCRTVFPIDSREVFSVPVAFIRHVLSRITDDNLVKRS